MNNARDDLLIVLSDLITLYNRHNEQHWKSWIQKSKDDIEANNFIGITYLLSAYGGMGSISDYFFAKKVWWSNTLKDMPEDNQLLQDLLSEAYRLANEIKREYDDDTYKTPNKDVQL